MRKTMIPAAVALLALAACNDSGKTAASSSAANTTDTPVPADPGAPSNGSAATPPSATPAASPTDSSIPAALQGRWGLVPADCTSTRGDAKGLLRIDGTSLEFYESVGKLTSTTKRSDTSLRGTFAFSGEGMNWNREVELVTTDNGKTLTRSEYGADALPAPLKYSKCA